MNGEEYFKKSPHIMNANWTVLVNSKQYYSKEAVIKIMEDFTKQEKENQYKEILNWIAGRAEIPPLTIRKFIFKFKDE